MPRSNARSRKSTRPSGARRRKNPEEVPPMGFQRTQGRAADALRPVTITRRYTKHAEGSVLVEFGDTKVLCTASVEDRVPPHKRGTGGGWVTAEYGTLTASPIRDFVAAVSVGVVGGTPLLDLEYIEDAACDTDMNVVMTAAGGFVEVQGTAEGAAFSRDEMDALLRLADKGIRELVAAQRRALAS